MLFKLINPSDPYTLEAEELDVACTVVLMLGRGMYSLEEVGGDNRVPMLAFADSKAWFKDHFGATLEVVLERCMGEKLPTVIACLEGVVAGDAKDREFYNAHLALLPTEAERTQFRASWLDKRRSSLNNIGATAWKLAAQLRKQTA